MQYQMKYQIFNLIIKNKDEDHKFRADAKLHETKSEREFSVHIYFKSVCILFSEENNYFHRNRTSTNCSVFTKGSRKKSLSF